MGGMVTKNPSGKYVVKAEEIFIQVRVESMRAHVPITTRVFTGIARRNPSPGSRLRRASS